MVIMTENPHTHQDWMQRKLGNDAYWSLIKRSNEIKKWTKEELKNLRKHLKKKIEDLNAVDLSFK